MAEKIGGTAYLHVDGRQYAVVGNFTYNLGRPMLEPKIGADGFQGFVEKQQAARIEGEIRITRDVDLEYLATIDDATCTLELVSGTVVVVRNGGVTSPGDANSEEGNAPFKFEGPSGEIVR